MDHQQDFDFARQSNEFTSAAHLLRYVAALNIEATKTEFVAAAVKAGYPAHAAGARFGESRRVTLIDEPHLIRLADGSLAYLE
jgi:hypothetical protein